MLNYKKMVQRIDELVNNDFCLSMEMKLMPKAELPTKQEIKKMIDIIGKVYTISHCITCGVCDGEYKI